MKKFKIVPMSAEYASKIQKALKDDFGNEVLEQIADGKGPCRVSLKPFKVGQDKRLLLSHSPFAIENAYNQPGPIFISKEPVKAYADIYRFPPEIKEDKGSFVITLIGYSKDQMMILNKLVIDEDIDILIAQIFDSEPDVEYLHARSAKACCYICKIERV